MKLAPAGDITKLEQLSLATRVMCAWGRVWGRRRGSTRLLNAVRARLRHELTSGALLEIPLCGSTVRVAVPWEELSGGTLVTFGENDENILRFLLCASVLPREQTGCFVYIGSNLGSFAIRLADLCRA